MTPAGRQRAVSASSRFRVFGNRQVAVFSSDIFSDSMHTCPFIVPTSSRAKTACPTFAEEDTLCLLTQTAQDYRTIVDETRSRRN